MKVTNNKIMKKWIWVPVAIALYFLAPLLFECSSWLNQVPLVTNQVGLLGRFSMLLPFFFIVEYAFLYKVAAIKELAILIGLPVVMLVLSFIIGLFYVHQNGGVLDNSFLFVLSLTNLILFAAGAFFFYKKAKA